MANKKSLLPLVGCHSERNIDLGKCFNPGKFCSLYLPLEVFLLISFVLICIVVQILVFHLHVFLLFFQFFSIRNEILEDKRKTGMLFVIVLIHC